MVYKTKEEYQQRTGNPAWSAGGASIKPVGQILPGDRGIVARTSITTFEPELTAPVIAHEVTHLVYNEFMAFRSVPDAARHQWLDEGLATYEEMGYYGETLYADLVQISRAIVKKEAYPLEDLVGTHPNQMVVYNVGRFNFMNRVQDYTNVDLWYWNVQFLVQFLIQREGQYAFYAFMNALKNDKVLIEALQEAYPGKWRSLRELESEWRQWL